MAQRRAVLFVAEKRYKTHGVIESMHERIRRVVPNWCCNHLSPPCLACSIEYLIENAKVRRPESPSAAPHRAA